MIYIYPLCILINTAIIILFNLIANNVTIIKNIQIHSVKIMVIFMGIGIHIILYKYLFSLYHYE